MFTHVMIFFSSELYEIKNVWKKYLLGDPEPNCSSFEISVIGKNRKIEKKIKIQKLKKERMHKNVSKKIFCHTNISTVFKKIVEKICLILSIDHFIISYICYSLIF